MTVPNLAAELQASLEAATASTARPPTSSGGGPVRLLQIRVYGTPAPQGSKRAIPMRNGRINLVESSKAVGPWRDKVLTATSHAIMEYTGYSPRGLFPLTVPVHVSAAFYLPRPASHYGTGRNAAVLRSAAPERPGVKPDLDKLIRAVLDAMTQARALTDDALVTSLSLWKFYATPELQPGAKIGLTWGA